MKTFILILLSFFLSILPPQTQHIITGKVVDSRNIPVPGALILLKTTLSATKKVYTGADGSYGFIVTDADYAIIPVASQYWVYDPAYKAVRLNADSVGNDFVATPSNELLPIPARTVKGRIKTHDDQPLSGIKVYLDNGLVAISDANGEYKLVTSAASHTITPLATKDYLFDPSRIRLTVSNDSLDNDFVAWRNVGQPPLLNLIVFGTNFVRIGVGETVIVNAKLLDENANLHPYISWKPMETDTTSPSCVTAVANSNGTVTLTGISVGRCRISLGAVIATSQRVQLHCPLNVIVE